jgi:hypothetical protein
MLGYESVWVVLVPVQVTELIFGSRRHAPWLRNRGLVIAVFLFLIGSRVAWYAWIKRVRPVIFHLQPYHPGARIIGSGVLAITLLSILAYFMRRVGNGKPASAYAAPPVCGASWCWASFSVARGTRSCDLSLAPEEPHVAFGVIMAGGIAWAVLVYLVLGRLARFGCWSDMHRWALTFGSTLLCMVAGFSGSSTWKPVDIYGKILLNLLAAIAFFLLLSHLRRYQLAGEPSAEDP